MVTAHARRDEGENETHQRNYWSGLIHSSLLKNMHFHVLSYAFLKLKCS